MNVTVLTDMFFMVLGGLGIFLLGMHNMSNGIQAIAGNKMRQLINAVTNNRIMAIIVGFFVTAIIQSSSVTSVMVVGFVNAELMTLTQALGVILGADIGTTVTGWILVLKIGKYGLPILGAAGIVYLFSKNDRTHYIAMMFMGIGMVFFGLELMKNGFKPIRSEPEFLALFSAFSPDTIGGLLLCAATGAIVTAIIQSSSAAVGIVMGMAVTGVLTFDSSVALVLGMNIGTTVTALLACLGTTTNAKRAAYGHTIIKVIGVMWILPLFPLYLKLLPFLSGVDPSTVIIKDGVETFPHILRGIAVAHTVFNIANVIIILPFVTLLTKVLIKISPDKPFKELPHLTKLDIRMLDTPMIVIEQSRNEILLIGKTINEIFDDLKHVISSDETDENRTKNIFKQEENIDIFQKEISTFLINTISAEITRDLVIEAQTHLRITDEYESISDQITNILKLKLKLKNSGISLTENEHNDILDLHNSVKDYFNFINTAIIEKNRNISAEATTNGSYIAHLFREKRSRHLEDIARTKPDPLLSISYMNMLTTYRNIKDHILNVAEVLTGDK
jgi:phosphate:Na+ symporter